MSVGPQTTTPSTTPYTTESTTKPDWRILKCKDFFSDWLLGHDASGEPKPTNFADAEDCASFVRCVSRRTAYGGSSNRLKNCRILINYAFFRIFRGLYTTLLPNGNPVQH